MTKKRSSILFLSIFDALSVGSVAGFLGTTIPDMDFSYNRSYLALAAFVCVILGIFSLFGMMHVQMLYPSLDYHLEGGKEVLEATPKNKKYFKLMRTLLRFGSASIVLGLFGWVLTYILYGF